MDALEDAAGQGAGWLVPVPTWGETKHLKRDSWGRGCSLPYRHSVAKKRELTVGGPLKVAMFRRPALPTAMTSKQGESSHKELWGWPNKPRVQRSKDGWMSPSGKCGVTGSSGSSGRLGPGPHRKDLKAGKGLESDLR